jgi:hypothetical protein
MCIPVAKSTVVLISGIAARDQPRRCGLALPVIRKKEGRKEEVYI